MISITIAATSFRPRVLPRKILGGAPDVAPVYRRQRQVEPRVQFTCSQPALREGIAKRGRCRIAVGVAYSELRVRR